MLGTCPGGDLSAWGFGENSEEEMLKSCRPLRVEVFQLEDKEFLDKNGWKPSEPANYSGRHGIKIPEGEAQDKPVSS